MTYWIRAFMLLLACSSSVVLAVNDAKGTADNPLISRFPQSHIVGQYSADYAEFLVPTGAMSKGPLPPVEKHEGKVDSLTYRANDAKYSALQIFRNYEAALNQAGFTTLFQCKSDAECGRKFVTQVYWYGDASRQGRHNGLDAPNTHGDRHQFYYWSGSKQVAGKTVFVMLLVVQDSAGRRPARVVLDVNETAELDTTLIVADTSVISPEKLTPDVPENNKPDVKGSFDHPLLSRFPDSQIVQQYLSEYNEFMVATGKMGRDPKLPPVLKFEGAVHSVTYRANDRRYSAIQIFRNYESALKDAEVQPIFSCRGDVECGTQFARQLYWYGDVSRQGRHKGLDAPNLHGEKKDYFYWAGKAEVNDKAVYVTLLVSQDKAANWPAVIVVDVNEVVELNTEQITIDLDGMQKDLAEQGKVVLDGVLFDTGKASLKAESREVVALIAQYLQQNPQDSFYVVGHTDSQGGYDMNMNLSRDRATTVATTLAQEFGVSASRLQAVGVGPVSPVLSNATAAGRKENRRVELVLKD